MDAEASLYPAPITSSTTANSISLPAAHGRVLDALLGSVRFFWNKVIYNVPLLNVTTDTPLLSQLDTLTYFTSKDEFGVRRGGHLPWKHLQDNLVDPTQSEAEQISSLRRKLAHLPANVAFSFTLCPEIREMSLKAIKAAFRKSGFTASINNTYLYKPNRNASGALIDQLKSDARNKVRSAQRDLELVEMSAEDYFEFYKANLVAACRKSYLDLESDRTLIQQALNFVTPQVRIIAARKKGSIGPIEAAIVLTSGEDGFMKLLRITHRRDNPDTPDDLPHKHATKLLVFEALRIATEHNMILDTDCFTPGGVPLYSRFGVFEIATRHEFRRRTWQTLLCKFTRPLLQLRKRSSTFIRSGLFSAIHIPAV